MMKFGSISFLEGDLNLRKLELRLLLMGHQFLLSLMLMVNFLSLMKMQFFLLMLLVVGLGRRCLVLEIPFLKFMRILKCLVDFLTIFYLFLSVMF